MHVVVDTLMNDRHREELTQGLGHPVIPEDAKRARGFERRKSEMRDEINGAIFRVLTAIRRRKNDSKTSGKCDKNSK